MVFNGQPAVIDPAKRLYVEGVEDILKSCRILINYSATSGYATLAHSSVQEFLTSDQCKSSTAKFFYLDESEDFCALSCLAIDYLNLPYFESGYRTNENETDRRLFDWPLLEYVSDAWPVFMRVMSWPLSATRYRTEKALQQFFSSARRPRGGNFGSWVQVYIPRHLQLDQSLSHPLYYAARAGMAEVVRMMLRVEGKGALELQGGSRRSTPLHVACAFGRTATVKLLLEEGANPNERNGCGERGIEWAEHNLYPDIVQLLLQHGATPIEQA
jgi:Ankyrin repeats (3 copies)